jgi:hypothetical protein
MSWSLQNRNERDIHVSMLAMIEESGKSPEQIRTLVPEILDDTMPELVELYIKKGGVVEKSG